MKKTLCLLLVVLLTLGLFPVSASAQNATVQADGGADQFGTWQGYSTYAVGETFADSFYYTDDWFLAEPSRQNDALALLSMQLTAAAVDGDEDGFGADLLQKLGFSELGFVGFGTEDPDDCAYTWAKKSVGDCTLIVIVVQSYAFDSATKEKGWTQNFLVNGESAEGEHYALAKAAEKTLDGITALSEGGRVKYWITGQSRGGALANLIAAKLPAHLAQSGAVNKGIYAYTFEAPAVTEPDIAAAANYSYIHNYICSDDPVPRVPMWGMVRYGVDIELKTEQTDAGVQAELIKLGSVAAELEVPDSTERAEDLIASLEQRVSDGAKPNRADYSRVRTDVFTDADGTEISVTYSYQAVFAKLMAVAFGGELADVSLGALLDDEELLHTAVLTFADAVVSEAKQGDTAAAPTYWAAAESMLQLINSVAGNGISLNQTDVYALLRLLGPLAVDVDYEPSGDDGTDTFGYISPLMGLAGSLEGLTYSHHFDTVIARLKALAPQPALYAVAFTTDTPQAGDAAAKLPEEIQAQLEQANTTWLTVSEAAWNIEDTLPDNSVAYLSLRLEAVGHSIFEDFSFSLNGTAPVECPTVSYADGVSQITAVWEFTIGTPETVTLSFETGNSAEAPAPIQAPRGKQLKYLARPAMPERIVEDGNTWLFRDWQNADGVFWDGLRAGGDMTLSALWTLLLDNIQISFAVPGIGDSIGMPTVPDGALYEITECSVTDKQTYDNVESIDGPGEYTLSLSLTAIPNRSVFALGLDEYGDPGYAGKLTVNGEDATVYYNAGEDEAPYLSVYYTFFILDAPFADVVPGAYYDKPVQWATIYEITKGTSATTFSPGKACTRAEAMTFLWRAAGSPDPVILSESEESQDSSSQAPQNDNVGDGVPGVQNPFADVKEGAYYYNAVLWAVEQGITKGTSATTFSPNEPCTRAEIVTFLWRFAGSDAPEQTENPFEDVPEGKWYTQAVLWAAEREITAGTSATTFSPMKVCTRAEIVTFLYRAHNQYII